VTLRSESEKWRVPESDPAGQPEQGRLSIPRRRGEAVPDDESRDRGPLIFCGMCGALNPSTNYYCAACGSTLVDAFHATEGLRVFERPDAASRIIEIVPAGTELDINEDPDAPSDYVRVRLPYGRLGYIRLAEVEALSAAGPSPRSRHLPDINVHARGCVSPTAALASLVLLVLMSTFTLYLLSQDNTAEGGFLAVVTCVIIAPITLLMILLYLMAREHEERLIEEEEEAEATESGSA
jgi:hypothetical protein